MDTFQIIQPSVLLTPYVKQYWFLTMENMVSASQRLVPLGCPVLSFHRGNHSQSYMYGITNRHTDLMFSGRVDFISVVFQPAVTGLLFGFPASELNHTYAELGSFNDPGLQELEKQLNDTSGNQACVELIEHFLFNRISRLKKQEDKRISTVIHSIYEGETNIDRLAGTACLSYKQFKRIFTEATGTNPKEFIQIQRFRKLHHLLQQHADLTIVQLAEECGYYDKSHLIKEVKDFSGFTPTGLMEACDPVYSPYHALFRSAFVDLK